LSEQDKKIKITGAADFSSFASARREMEAMIKVGQKLAEVFNQIGSGFSKINTGPSGKLGLNKYQNIGGASSTKIGLGNPLTQSILDNKNALRSMAVDSKNSMRILTDSVKESVSRQTEQVDKLKKKLDDLSSTYDRLKTSGKLSGTNEERLKTRFAEVSGEYTTAKDSLRDLKKIEASGIPQGKQGFLKRLFSERVFSEEGAVAKSGIGQFTGLSNLTKGGAIAAVVAAAVGQALSVGKTYAGEMVAQPFDLARNKALLGGSFGGMALGVSRGDLKVGAALRDIMLDSRGRGGGIFDRPLGMKESFEDNASNIRSRKASIVLDKLSLGNLMPGNMFKAIAEGRRQFYNLNTDQKADMLKMVQMQIESDPMKYAHLDYLQENAGSMIAFSRATGAGWKKYKHPMYTPGVTPGSFADFKKQNPMGYMDPSQAQKDADWNEQQAIFAENKRNFYKGRTPTAEEQRIDDTIQRNLNNQLHQNALAKKAGNELYALTHSDIEKSPLENYKGLLTQYSPEEVAGAVESLTPFLGRRKANAWSHRALAMQGAGVGNLGGAFGQSLIGGDKMADALYQRLNFMFQESIQSTPTYGAFKALPGMLLSGRNKMSTRLPIYGMNQPLIAQFAQNVAGFYGHTGPMTSGRGITDIYAALSQSPSVAQQLRYQAAMGPGVQGLNSFLAGGPDPLQTSINMYSAIKALPMGSYDSQKFLAKNLNFQNLADVLNQKELPKEFSDRGINRAHIRNYYEDLEKKMFNREIDESDSSSSGKFKRMIRDQYGGSFSGYFSQLIRNKKTTPDEIQDAIRQTSNALLDWEVAQNQQQATGMAMGFLGLGNVSFTDKTNKGSNWKGGFFDPSRGSPARAMVGLGSQHRLEMERKIGEESNVVRGLIQAAPSLSQQLSQAGQNINQTAADLVKSLKAFTSSLDSMIKTVGQSGGSSTRAAAPR
jgi:hypothetical protein